MTTVATSPAEAQSRFGRAFYGGATQPELDERVQLGQFLMAAAFSDILRFPVEVTHMRDKRPDFLLSNGGVHVGVEVTKVANKDLECARSLQHKHGLGVMTVTPFLKSPTGNRNRREVLQAAFALPAQVFGNSEEEEDECWLTEVKRTVLRKTELLNRPDSCRQDQNWLLVWDRLGSSTLDLVRRMKLLQPWLDEMWLPDWFNRVIFQENYFPTFIVVSKGTELEFLETVTER